MTRTASVVIPAHNEERVLGRLLTALLAEAGPDELDVVVVANGCSDRTAQVAAGFAAVRVIDTPVASKAKALRMGDEVASAFPRFYVDADVVFRTADVRSLARALAPPGVLAAGPAREIPMDGVGWPVRWYYDVWQQLPGVREELFARGVIGVAKEGHGRLAGLPEAMSDDLAIAVAFEVDERIVVADARSVIMPPRTYRDLLRRRVRAMLGNRQYARLAGSDELPGGTVAPDDRTSSGDTIASRRPPRTGLADLGRLGVRRPRLAPKIVVFAMTAVISRYRAGRALRRGDSSWLRDESSRTS